MGSRHTHAPSHWVLNNDYYISTWLLSTHGSDDIHLWTLPIFLISTTPPVKFYDCILKVAVLSCLQNLSAGRHTDMMHSPQMFSKLLGCDKCLSVYLQVSIPGDIDFTGNIYIYIFQCVPGDCILHMMLLCWQKSVKITSVVVPAAKGVTSSTCCLDDTHKQLMLSQLAISNLA